MKTINFAAKSVSNIFPCGNCRNIGSTLPILGKNNVNN